MTAIGGPPDRFDEIASHDAHRPSDWLAMAPLDINLATQDDLDGIDGLRGHGFEIVRYRDERGQFTSLRQLDEVPGLSGKVDDATRGRLTVQRSAER